ncbi:MAG: MmgE/PrpD family protein [Anaerolineae bacterium]
MTAHDARTALSRLAQFAADLRLEDVPPPVIERAHAVLRDTVGVILGGLQAPEVARLLDHARAYHHGEARLLAHAGTVTPEWAALVYGTAGTTLEYDEGHAFARGHAAIHAVSVALALAGADDTLSGTDCLLALLVGYEVAARIGVATRLKPEVHPFGAWGVIGAAAVAGKIARLNGDEMLALFELAASYAITPSFYTAFQGKNVRNTYAGMVNHNGLLALTMYQLGFEGEQDGVQTTFGAILGDRFTPEALTDVLGTRYEIMRGYFKPYSACRYSHAAVDATLAIREQITLNAIEQVTVATYDFAAKLNEPAPQTPLAARFSIPYIVAATLHDGDANAASFTEEAIQREAVRDLARRITVIEAPPYTALLPDQRAARVSVITREGQTISSEALGSKGDPDQPMSADELRTKFDTLASALPAEARAQLWEQLGNLARLPKAASLFAINREDEKQSTQT